MIRKVRHTCLVFLDSVECTIEVKVPGDGQGNTIEIIASNDWFCRNVCGQKEEGCEGGNREHDENQRVEGKLFGTRLGDTLASLKESSPVPLLITVYVAWRTQKS